MAWRVGLLPILLLLSFGICAGPVLGWIDPDESFGELLLPFVSLPVALILDEGGRTLKRSELPKAGGVVRSDIRPISVLNAENRHRTSTICTRRPPWGLPGDRPSTAITVQANETRSVAALLLCRRRVDARGNNLSMAALTCQFISGIQRSDRYGGGTV